MDDPLAEEEFPIQHDRRHIELGPFESPPPIDVQTAEMNARIQAIHCRLLERATGGRLTFRGHQVVRTVYGRAAPHAPRQEEPSPGVSSESEGPPMSPLVSPPVSL